MSCLLRLPAVLGQPIAVVAHTTATLVALPGRVAGLMTSAEQALAGVHAAVTRTDALLDRVEGVTGTADGVVRAASRAVTAAAVTMEQAETTEPHEVDALGGTYRPAQAPSQPTSEELTMTDGQDTFVIVGASLAGAKAAETLRAEGFTGRVVLAGDEHEPPYERPPLSKGYLQGTEDKAALYVHDQSWYRENSVELQLGRRVISVDRAGRQVEFAGGERLEYRKLLLATGASPRRLELPGADLDGVYYLRRIEDSERLRAAIHSGGRVAIVGAGWIGLETAAAAREYGCEVTVIEPQPAPLQAALGPEMGGFFADVHRQHGVDLRLGAAVTEFRGSGQVAAVVTDDGSEIPAEVVVIGVGVRPNTELAEQAGLAVENGVLVDQALRTADPDVYAAGDVANAVNPLYGARIRVEHWANALHGGPAAARAMLGQQASYDPAPYFFTDQYDIGMEFAGWFSPGGYDDLLIRGDLEAQTFHAFWLVNDKVVAGMHINQWDQGIEPVQELIRTGRPVDRHQLVDPAVPLADILKS